MTTPRQPTRSAPAPRVLITKLGLDGHDRGLRLLSRQLRDIGAEVVLLGIGTTPEEIAATAVQEDVGVVAISMLSGAHLTLVPRLLDALRAQGVDVPVICGGLIPAADAETLRELGVTSVSPAGISVPQAAAAIVAVARGAAPRV